MHSKLLYKISMPGWYHSLHEKKKKTERKFWNIKIEKSSN
jgi:hypothetical protein